MNDGMRLRAAQDGADAREQFAQVERFGQIIVRAEFQAHDAIDVVLAPGEDDDRHARRFTQLARQGHAVFRGQFQIEQDQIDDLARHGVAHGGPIRRTGYAQVVVAEVVGDHLAQVGIVIDYQDMSGDTHA